MPSLEEVFSAFANGQDMDGRSFQKCMKASGMIGRGLSQTDFDLIFAKRKAKKITYTDFLMCLGDVATRRSMSKEEVVDQVIAASGPVYDSGTTRGSAGTSGPERFFYDKTSYTGTHTKGGPTLLGSGLATEGYAELSGLIRREHVQDDWVQQRKQQPQEQQQPVQEAGLMETEHLQQGAFRPPAAASPTQRRPRSSSSSVTAAALQQSAGAQTLHRPASRGSLARGTSPAADRPRSRGASTATVKGPERFYYDQSTYTGTDARRAGDRRAAEQQRSREGAEEDECLDAPALASPTSDERLSTSRGRSTPARRQGPECLDDSQPACAAGLHMRTRGASFEAPVLLGAGGGQRSTQVDPRTCVCGNELMSDSVFCRKCGTRWGTPAQDSIASPATCTQKDGVSRATRGPERFFYDKSSYTGVHQAGGPSTIDTHSGGRVGDLSQITRAGLGPKQGR